MGFQLAIEIPEGDPWLNTNLEVLCIQVDHAAHEAREVQDDPWTERLACQSGSSTARENGQSVFDGVFDAPGHIVGMPWANDCHRCDLVKTRVAGVHLGVQRVAEDLAVEDPP